MQNNFLYLIWKDPQTRRNFIVGKLTKGEQYTFSYCEEYNDAKKCGWRPLNAFPENIDYNNEILFPVFASRLPDPKRRDIQKILEKYELIDFDEFELLRKSSARLPIDTYEFIDPIFPDEETVQRDFFIMGIRHHALCKGENCNELPPVDIDELLVFKPEPENAYDPFAIRVEKADGQYLGYVPRYYNKSILERLENGLTYSCKVLEVNKADNCSECIKVRLNMPTKINNFT